MSEIKMCDDIEYMYVDSINIHPRNPRSISPTPATIPTALEQSLPARENAVIEITIIITIANLFSERS